MNILILGGNSAHHKDWIRDLGRHLTSEHHTVRLHDYAHWETGEAFVDIEKEINQLQNTVDDLQDYHIIAKSIGTVIATLAIKRGLLQPAQCIFLGIPLDGLASNTDEFTAGLAALPRTTVIQNEFDPHGAAFIVEQYCQSSDMLDMTFITELEKNTHDYLDFALIARQLS